MENTDQQKKSEKLNEQKEEVNEFLKYLNLEYEDYCAMNNLDRDIDFDDYSR